MRREPENSICGQVELANCNFVKTILMIIIVVYHCVVFWTETWFTKNPVYESNALNYLAQWMNSFHIYGFVLVSGYLFYYLKYEKRKYREFIPFVVNKIKRLLVPYLFLVLVWVIPIQSVFLTYDIETMLRSFVLAENPNQLWFLVMLFGVFIFFWPLSDFFVKHDMTSLAVGLVVYGIGIIGDRLYANIFQIWSICTFMPIFLLGFKMRQFGSAILRRIPIAIWLIGDILLFVLTKYLLTLDNVFCKLLYLGVTFILHIVGAMMAFVILQKLADCINWKDSKAFLFLHKNSMPIYLFHQQAIYFFIYWWNGRVNPYVNVVINFVGTMLISLFVSEILMKFKWTRILIGEK